MKYDFTRRLKKVKKKRFTEEEKQEILKKQLVEAYKNSLRKRMKEK